MFFHTVYKSGQIFLPFYHNSRVWRTDRRTDRILIARPRLHSMQRGNKTFQTQSRHDERSRHRRALWSTHSKVLIPQRLTVGADRQAVGVDFNLPRVFAGRDIVSCKRHDQITVCWVLLVYRLSHNSDYQRQTARSKFLYDITDYHVRPSAALVSGRQLSLTDLIIVKNLV